MTRSNSIAPQVILLFVLGSGLCIWGRQVSENYEKMRMLYGYPSGFKRLPSYDFGLGKRSVEDSGSYEEQLSPMDALMEREAIYPYPIGKRTRAYSFGLGKRQERRSKIYSFGLGKRGSLDAIADYDGNASPPTAERRASPQRQFSFGLGKRETKE